MLKYLGHLQNISLKSCQSHFLQNLKYASTFQRKLHIRSIVIRNEYQNKLFSEINSNNRFYLSSASDKGKNEKQRFYIILSGTLFTLGACFFAVMYFKGNFNIPEIKKTSLQKSQKNKKRSSIELPKEIPYLIIGAGTAAHVACRAIRSADTNAKVLIVGEEDYYPYMRPPLSKELWHLNDDEALKKLNFKQWNGRERSIFYEKDAFYTPVKDLVNAEHGGVSVAMGIKAIKIDVVDQKVHFDNGQIISYGKCLLATGGIPKNLSILSNADFKVQEKVTLFRTIEDFFYLDSLIRSGKEVLIVGGGFLGSELACSLGKRALENKSPKVKQIFPEKGNMGLILPEYLSVWTTEQVRKEGVEVIPECSVVGCSFNKNENKVELLLSNGEKVKADEIVVAVGLDPKTELAKESGLEVDPKFGGFLVNAELEARTNIWAAGDAACFYDTKLGRRRVEHHDHAVVSGRLAGENMVTKTSRKPYWHQSMFWSDLGPSVGYDGIGLTDAKLETVSVFAQAAPSNTPRNSHEDKHLVDRTISEKEEKHSAKSVLIEEIKVSDPGIKSDDFSKGVIFYLRNDIVVGIILWNLFNRMPVARKVINEGRKFEDLNEVAKLFRLFGEADEDDEDEDDEAPRDESKKSIL